LPNDLHRDSLQEHRMGIWSGDVGARTSMTSRRQTARSRGAAARRRFPPQCEVMERRLVLSSYVVTSPGDGALGNTLRWAMLQVNSGSQPATIQFDIPGNGVQMIQLSSPLPALTTQVVIDGTSQHDYQGAPLIQLDGSLLPAGHNGLVLSAGNSTVLGLSIV